MKKFLVLINCKFEEFASIDNKLITTNKPIYELRRLFSDFSIQRGNGLNWNIMLWNKDTDTHLYYVVKHK